MTVSGWSRWMCAGVVSVSVAACGGGEKAAAPAASAPAASTPASAPATAAAASADNPCPLTVEQVAAVTGAPMTLTGACTFFPANGSDRPHVFYVLQIPMLCGSIAPSEIGFTETLEGLPAKAAYVRDQADGSHVLVCRNNARPFDMVAEIKNDKAKNREA